jgi:putative membrane protein
MAVLFTACSKKTDIDISADTSGRTVDTAPPGAMTGPAPGALSAQDRQFVAKALLGNKSEVDLGNLALKKAKAANVKEFAQMMVSDHSKAFDELMSLASAKGLPADTAATSEQMAVKEKLMKSSGKQFDKDYMSVMVMDHEKARDDFQLESTSGSDAELKAYAQKYLDGITQHLQKARGMDTVALSATK